MLQGSSTLTFVRRSPLSHLTPVSTIYPYHLKNSGYDHHILAPDIAYLLHTSGELSEEERIALHYTSALR